MKVAIIHTNADYLSGLRLPLMKEIVNRGCSVTAIAPNMSDAHINALKEHSIGARRCTLDATGLNPLADIKSVFSIKNLLDDVKPDIVLCNTAKAVIFGSFASYLARVKFRYSLVSGLGYAFTDDGRVKGFKKILINRIMKSLYYIAFKINKKVIFQNSDDKDLIVDSGICRGEKAELVAGSGVDVKEFSYQARDSDSPVFVMVGRVLYEKGVGDYLAAARLVKEAIPQAKFYLVGDIDKNPSALSFEEVNSFVEDGTITWVRGVRDVRPWLYEANVFVLPSFREGLPRSTLEAMSTGLPVVTTDVPGCRETVETEKNGFLVPVRNPEMLSHAMIKLGKDLSLAASMGVQSRKIIEDKFDVELINAKMCKIMGLGSFN